MADRHATRVFQQIPGAIKDFRSRHDFATQLSENGIEKRPAECYEAVRFASDEALTHANLAATFARIGVRP